MDSTTGFSSSSGVAGQANARGNSTEYLAKQRHVWVASVDGAAAPHPGLVHAWRRSTEGLWQARCTYIVDDGSAEGVVVTQWLPARSVRPACYEKVIDC